MTVRMRAKRMRLLIASFVAILGLVANLKWTVARLDAVATGNAVGRRPEGWVVLNGVEYRPTEEVSPPDRDSRRTHRAGLEACDPVGGGRLWKVTIREGSWPESGQEMDGMRGAGMPGLPGQGMLDPRWLSEDQFRARFTLKLAARGREILATSSDGGTYLVDPESRQVRQVRAPTPPKPPIRDARLPGGTLCEVHDRPLLEDVVPIRYGFNAGVGNPEEYEVRRARFPNATTSIGGSCLVGASREARVLYCPECRGAESEWAGMRAVERAGDEDPPAGVD